MEYTINGRWAGSRPGFRFDSGCSAFLHNLFLLRRHLSEDGCFLLSNFVVG
ncbi:hypothetical protein CLOSTHATH_04579 [Hungatella hathewayi DSM 13479]|uniref:Uncharacterized protein n=1 Tax=Hungatella hathewayi DSM 13479 TaxID=566550 RepID=D3ALT3_9FIRM|nr:hypothetical protein CLOSTHATH_04579 [Hungatella hathewayi DSM 13479]